MAAKLLVASVALALSAAGCFDPCPGKLSCSSGVCCPDGMPYECGGKCYSAPGPCGGSAEICTSGSGGGGEACSTPPPCGPGTHQENCSCVSNSTSGGGGSGGGGGGGSGGAPGSCTTGAHPAWQPGECTFVYQAGNCKVQFCTRVVSATNFCCEGYDLGWVFEPCDNACGSCANAAQTVVQMCPP